MHNYTNTAVDIESAALSHVEVDEARQLVQMHGRLVLTWNDTKIAWDSRQWGVNWLNFYWVQIWTPDIVQTNAPEALPGRIQRKILAANYTGQVERLL